ncbi:MAG: nuclear transport factor 2 family protein [Candidatus Latescibacterota bacterium]|nr:MAG: nuclear transport factor 2 family protein [Candidatus Latescibacterota bacterium]
MEGDADRVRLLNQRFYDALSSQNLLRMEQIWSHSTYVRCVHPGWKMLSGWDSIRDSWRNIFTNAICLTVEPLTAQVEVHGAIAVVTCHERISSFTLEGSTVSKAQSTNIFEKSNGRWQLILHHSSPVADPASAKE